jgi:tetratricopeptide (TPR) repeat protein
MVWIGLIVFFIGILVFVHSKLTNNSANDYPQQHANQTISIDTDISIQIEKIGNSQDVYDVYVELSTTKTIFAYVYKYREELFEEYKTLFKHFLLDSIYGDNKLTNIPVNTYLYNPVIDDTSRQIIIEIQNGKYDDTIAANLIPLYKLIDYYTKVIEMNPSDLDAYVWRSFTYEKANDFKKAIADINKVIYNCPDNAQLYNYRGVLYYSDKQYSPAKRDFQKTLKLSPDTQSAQFLIKNAKRPLHFPQWLIQLSITCTVIGFFGIPIVWGKITESIFNGIIFAIILIGITAIALAYKIIVLQIIIGIISFLVGIILFGIYLQKR